MFSQSTPRNSRATNSQPSIINFNCCTTLIILASTSGAPLEPIAPNTNSTIQSTIQQQSRPPHSSKHKSLNKELNLTKKQRKKQAKKQAKFDLGIPSPDPVKPKPHQKKPAKTVEESDPFKVRVHINKVDSPDEIYVSQPGHSEQYQRTMRSMQKFYESHVGSWDRQLKLHDSYCVYSRKDKLYCRAQFLGMTESEPPMARMSLVDLAEVDDIALEMIQPLDRRFFDAPMNIFKVKLAGVRPCGGSSVWQSSSCQKLKDIIQSIGEVKYYITLVVSIFVLFSYRFVCLYVPANSSFDWPMNL